MASSRFAKPAWLQQKEATQSQAAAGDSVSSTQKRDAVDIFKRSADTQAVVAAEQERRDRRLQEKKNKTKEREENLQAKRQARLQKDDEEQLSEEQGCKRRRVSTEEEDSRGFQESPASNSSTSRKKKTATTAPAPSTHIIIDDSEDDSGLVERKLTPVKGRIPKEATATVHDDAVVILSDDDTNIHGSASADAEAAHTYSDVELSEDEGPNPVMMLFIEPRLPNTKPLLVRRRYNQKLREVRLAWCKHNDLSPSQTAEVILTWNNRRLFDIQSCKGIGIRLDEEDQPYIVTGNDIRARIENVALVATTRQILEAEKRKDSQRNDILPAEPTEAEEVAQSQTSAAPIDRQYKIILRSKSFTDYKLLFKDDTTIEKAAAAFRRQNKIADDKNIVIMYDGDVLAPDTRIGDTEIVEDYDGEAVCLDIHLR